MSYEISSWGNLRDVEDVCIMGILLVGGRFLRGNREIGVFGGFYEGIGLFLGKVWGFLEGNGYNMICGMDVSGVFMKPGPDSPESAVG